MLKEFSIVKNQIVPFYRIISIYTYLMLGHKFDTPVTCEDKGPLKLVHKPIQILLVNFM